jgi:hypothetical protein
MIVASARSQLDTDRLTLRYNMTGRKTYRKKQGNTLDTSNGYCRQAKRDFIPRAYTFTVNITKNICVTRNGIYIGKESVSMRI